MTALIALPVVTLASWLALAMLVQFSAMPVGVAAIVQCLCLFGMFKACAAGEGEQA